MLEKLEEEGGLKWNRRLSTNFPGSYWIPGA
jgi:hypothetical protein